MVADADAAHRLELAIDNSLHDLLERYPGSLVLNLSGGADSTLLLAKYEKETGMGPYRPPHTFMKTGEMI